MAELTRDQICEGNKLIDKFFDVEGSIYTDKGWVDACKYHTSWDWLRPVMDKCWNLTTEEDREFKGLGLFELSLFASIEEVWEAVVEFINWYNFNIKK